MATADTWRDILRTNRSSVQMLIELDTGLWGELKSRNVFTRRQLDCVWPPGKKMTIDRVETLLEMLEKKSFVEFHKFCDALDKTGQSRLVKDGLSSVRESDDQSAVVASDSIDGSLSALCCPLSLLALFYLKKHWNDIVETMVTDADVFGKLTEKKVFTEFQLKSLKDYHEESARNEALLHRLEKASQWQFDVFCDIMTATNQLVIANYLRPFGRTRPLLAHSTSSGSLQSSSSENQTISSDALNSLCPDVVDRCPMPEPLPLSNAENLRKECSDIEFCVSSQEFVDRVSQSVMNKIAYKCDSRPLGRAIVINNEYFATFKHREGAAEDGKWLEYLFHTLHFETQVYNNLSSTEIVKLLKTESKAEHHKRFDVFALFLLSHGRRNEIYGRDERTVSMDIITTLFDGKNCSHLINKPKLFFIQACQGETKTKGVIESDFADVSASNFSSEKKSDDLRLNTEVSVGLGGVEEDACGAAAAEGREEIVPGDKEISDHGVQNASIETEHRGNEEAKTESVDDDGPDQRLQGLGSDLCTPGTTTENVFDEDKTSTDGNPVSEKQPSHEDVPFESHELVHDLERSLSLDEGSQRIQCDDISSVAPTHEKADMAIVYSTAGGYVALRHSEKGSFFVQSLVEVFARRAHEDDLQSMLTEVMNRLHDQTMTGQKQMGEKRDTLRRKVYLLPRPPHAPHCPTPVLPQDQMTDVGGP